MVIDRAGYRLNVGIVLTNESGRVFWGKRQGHDAWQFPQGGLAAGETALEAMFRELNEEVGLDRSDVESLAFEMFGLSNLPELNKLQASGIIDELLSRYGKKRSAGQRFNGRASR